MIPLKNKPGAEKQRRAINFQVGFVAARQIRALPRLATSYR